MLTADQFVGRDDGLLQQRRQDSHICRKTRTFPLSLRRNQGIEFLTCDGCEDEYNK